MLARMQCKRCKGKYIVLDRNVCLVDIHAQSCEVLITPVLKPLPWNLELSKWYFHDGALCIHTSVFHLYTFVQIAQVLPWT